MKIIQWLQAGNLIKSYNDNPATDKWTGAVIGGVSIPGTTWAVLSAVALFVPAVGAWVTPMTGLAGLAATQIIPIVQHYMQKRAAAKQAAAQADLALLPAFAPTPVLTGTTLTVPNDDTPIISYTTPNGMHAATGPVKTLGQAKSWDASTISVRLTDDREWKL